MRLRSTARARAQFLSRDSLLQWIRHVKLRDFRFDCREQRCISFTISQDQRTLADNLRDALYNRQLGVGPSGACEDLRPLHTQWTTRERRVKHLVVASASDNLEEC